MEQEDQDISAQLLANLARQQYAYSFGGGTIGGDIWNWRPPTYGERMAGKNELIPELKPELRGKVNVTPAGRGAAQELRGMREAGGRPYVEAPELFRRGRGGGKGVGRYEDPNKFYSTVTGRPMGTLMGMGEYEGFGKTKEQPQPSQLAEGFKKISPMQDEALTRETQINTGMMGDSGMPMGFTGFGQMARDQKAEQYQTPFGGGMSSIGTGLFGVPRFPFAGATSGSERATSQYSPMGIPRFPFANY